MNIAIDLTFDPAYFFGRGVDGIEERNVTYQMDQDSGSTLLLLPSPPASTRPVLVLSLCPDSEPWFLMEHAVDWAQKVGAQLDLCAVLSPRDPWGVFENSSQGIRQQARRAVRVKRWLGELRDAIPAAYRGEVTVLEGGAITELAAHVKDCSALLIGRSERRWWAPLQAPVADQIAHRSQIPVLVVAGRRPRGAPVVHMPTPLADGLHSLRWMSRYLPHCRIVVPPDRTGGAARRRSTLVKDSAPPRPASTRRAAAPHPDARHSGLLPNTRPGDADLVVVPASRTRSMRELLQVSLTRSVLNSSTCSVLVVPASWAA